MDYNKNDMRFLCTTDEETANKLRCEGFIEITEPGSTKYKFINNGNKLTFDLEKHGGVYTNILNV